MDITKRILFLVAGIVFWANCAQATCTTPCIATVTASSTGGSGFTSAAIDSSGGSAIIAVLTAIQTVAVFCGDLTDSKSNTYSALTMRGNDNDGSLKIFYVQNPTVGASHTFTVGLNGCGAGYATLIVGIFSGMDIAGLYDMVENGATTASGTSLSTGSITPSENCTVVIAGVVPGADAGTFTINSSLAIIDQVAFSSGNHYGGAMAYYQQPTAGAINPQWSWSNTVYAAAAVAAFQDADATCGAVAGGNGSLLLMGVGK